MLRCQCGYVMPSPLHENECEHYEDFKKRLTEQIEKERLLAAQTMSFQKWSESIPVKAMRGIMAAVTDLDRVDNLLKEAFELAHA